MCKYLQIIVMLIFIPGILYSQVKYLDKESHFGPVTKIRSNGNNGFVLTCSTDGCAKLWSEDGKLLRVLKVSTKYGPEGMLFACALSPDDSVAAVGGWAGWDRNGKYSVYLFSTHSGRLIGSLSGLKQAISELAFSPDDERIAVGLFNGGGVAVYRLKNHNLEKLLTGYVGDVYSCDFDKNGRLLTVCGDGVVRLYNNNLEMDAAINSAGKRPIKGIFSADGGRIAIGFEDLPMVGVLDGTNLELLSDLYVDDDMLRFTIPSWKPDGCLAAAATSCKNQQGYIIHFSPTYCDMIALPFGGILDFRAYRDEEFLLAGRENEFGVCDKNGIMITYHYRQSIDFTKIKAFQVDGKGGTINIKIDELPPIQFSIQEELLTIADKVNFSDSSEKNETVISESEIRGIIGTDEKIIAQKKVDRHLIISTWWRLLCLDEKGKIIWSSVFPRHLCAVNFAVAQDLVIAALEDGTIRWFDLNNGKELLSLFIHKNLMDWVAWTPDGSWNATKLMEEYIMSQETGEANEEFAVSGLSEIKGERDPLRIINSINNVGTGGIASMITCPEVKIRSPADNENVKDSIVIVSLKVETNLQPIDKITVEVNGEPRTPTYRGLQPILRGQRTYSIPVLLIRGKNTVKVTVSTGQYESKPAVLHLTCNLNVTASGKIDKPDAYLIAAGISKYRLEGLSLKYASKDGCDFTKAILAQKGGLYGNVHARLFTDSLAGRERIYESLDWLRRKMTSRDVAIIFFAGHGMKDDKGRTYFLPFDADTGRPERTCISFRELKWYIGQIPGKVVLFLDACYAGNIVGSRGVFPIVEEQAVSDLTSAEDGSILFCSSSKNQLSQENIKWQNSAFTKALIEGLNGKADYYGFGVVTVSMLELYISQRVKELTGGKQTPVVIKSDSMRDFPIALKTTFEEF